MTLRKLSAMVLKMSHPPWDTSDDRELLLMGDNADGAAALRNHAEILVALAACVASRVNCGSATPTEELLVKTLVAT